MHLISHELWAGSRFTRFGAQSCVCLACVMRAMSVWNRCKILNQCLQPSSQSCRQCFGAPMPFSWV